MSSPTPEARGLALPTWALLALALAMVTFFLLVASFICGPLFILVMPPVPPIYPDATLFSSTNEAHGIDIWIYRTPDDPCAVYAMYEAEADTCTMTPGFCDAPRDIPPGRYSEYLGTCKGSEYVYPFRWAWEVNIRELYFQDDVLAEFDITRTVFWLSSDD